MAESEVQRLMAAVRELGESCAALANAQNGADTLLREAHGALMQSRDTSDIAGSLQVAGTCWQSIEQAAKAAAVEAHRFASSQL